MSAERDLGRTSLLMSGAGQRLATASIAVAALWLAVAWALGLAG